MFGIGKALFEHYGNGLLAQSTVPQEDVTKSKQQTMPFKKPAFTESLNRGAGPYINT